MADISGYINLGQVVDSLINEQEISRKQRKRLLQIAIEGFSRELMVYHMNYFKAGWLPVSSTLGTVAFPSDYVDFISIGTVNANGQFWSFSEDDNLIIPAGTISGQDTLNTSRGENQYDARYVNPSYTTKGGVNTNYYKIDSPNRRIIITGSTTLTYALLHYVSSGVNLSGNTVIPIYAERALKDYIMWRISKGVERDRRKYEYQTSANDLRGHEGMFTKDQYLDMVYETTYRGIKR